MDLGSGIRAKFHYTPSPTALSFIPRILLRRLISSPHPHPPTLSKIKRLRRRRVMNERHIGDIPVTSSVFLY